LYPLSPHDHVAERWILKKFITFIRISTLAISIAPPFINNT